MAFWLVEQPDGRAWRLSSEALVIGRGEACAVRVHDPMASRVHCKIWIDGDRAYVEDLGSRNATLVNGEPVQKVELTLGDRIGIGSRVYDLRAEEPPSSETRRARDETTVDLLHVLAPASQSVKEAKGPATVAQYKRLYSFSVSLSRVSEFSELLDAINAGIADAFEPDVSWLVQNSLQGRHLTHHFRGDRAELPPPDALAQCLQTGQALLIPELIRDGAGRRVQTTMIAPVTQHSRVLGAVGLRSYTRRRVYDEHDVGLLGAMAQTVAPYWRLTNDVEQLRRDVRQLSPNGVAADIVGDSPRLRDAIALADQVAGTALSVLLLGETGVGKELFAHRIHNASRRSDGPFVAINCAAVPQALFESEMFGHEAGAFTGAAKLRRGRLEQAHGGTLFLDEIGDLHPENQARILRALDNSTFHRVGGTDEISVDVRIIAATNKSLPALMGKGAFREDLYHRLAGMEIHLAALRDRVEDIPVLAKTFLQTIAARDGGPVAKLSDAATEKLIGWRWPGNVRELRMCIERAAMFAAGSGKIEPEHLLVGDHTPAVETHPPEAPAARAATAPDVAEPIRPLAEVEADYIRLVVERHEGNLRAAAKALGIARATLYRKLDDANGA